MTLPVTIAANNNHQKEKKRLYEDLMLKSSIVNYLELKTKKQELDYEAEFVKFDSIFWDLIQLFDSMDWEESLRTLASLSYYKFGAHGGRLYHCVVIRKGKQIKEYLKDTLSHYKNECLENLGTNSKYCVNKEEHEMRIKTLLNRINVSEKCEFE